MLLLVKKIENKKWFLLDLVWLDVVNILKYYQVSSRNQYIFYWIVSNYFVIIFEFKKKLLMQNIIQFCGLCVLKTEKYVMNSAKIQQLLKQYQNTNKIVERLLIQIWVEFFLICTRFNPKWNTYYAVSSKLKLLFFFFEKKIKIVLKFKQMTNFI